MLREEDAQGPNPCPKRSHGDLSPIPELGLGPVPPGATPGPGPAVPGLLPSARGSGEPVRGGVAGMFFGGSGGGAGTEHRGEKFSWRAAGSVEYSMEYETGLLGKGDEAAMSSEPRPSRLWALPGLEQPQLLWEFQPNPSQQEFLPNIPSMPTLWKWEAIFVGFYGNFPPHFYISARAPVPNP